MLSIGIVICCLTLVVNSFSPVTNLPAGGMVCNRRCALAAFGSNEGGELRKGQERRMERSSIEGADAISKLNVNERTKRAMLAEVVEDRIFEITEEIEQIVSRNDGILEGEDREQAVELAKMTKSLQLQYDDLVNGRPSHILNLDVKDDWEEEGFQ